MPVGGKTRSFLDLRGAIRILASGTPFPNEGLSIWKDRRMTIDMPGSRPANPRFSCGPCTKRPGWSLDVLKDAPLGRSHRAKIGKSRLKQAIDLTREILEIPADYKVAIVPASDTGAV